MDVIEPESDLVAIGYWQSEGEPDLPQPHQFVGPALPEDLRRKLSVYLSSGVEFMAFMGHSHCRFGCGIPNRSMGCRDLTDGTWVWPEGLVHYLDVHGVVLPARFVEHAARSAWQIRDVSLPSMREGADGSSRIPISYDFWKTFRAVHG